MLIRELVLNDISALLEMAARVEGFHVSEQASYFWSPEQLERWIEAREDVLLGAEVDGKLVGFVLTTLHQPTGKVTWENQFVLPEHRGGGIASALAVEMRRRLKEKGATYLVAFVRTDNSESLACYIGKGGLRRGYDFAWLEENL